MDALFSEWAGSLQRCVNINVPQKACSQVQMYFSSFFLLLLMLLLMLLLLLLLLLLSPDGCKREGASAKSDPSKRASAELKLIVQHLWSVTFSE